MSVFVTTKRPWKTRNTVNDRLVANNNTVT
jgi:hypothetical protein